MLWWFYFRQVLYRNLFLFFYISLICKSFFHGADDLVIFTVFRGAFSSITDKNSLLNVSNCSSGSSKLLKIKNVSLTHPFHIFSRKVFEWSYQFVSWFITCYFRIYGYKQGIMIDSFLNGLIDLYLGL